MPVPSQSRTYVPVVSVEDMLSQFLHGFYRRTEFTETDADYITQYLAKYTPDGRDRSGNQIWKALGENVR